MRVLLEFILQAIFSITAVYSQCTNGYVKYIYSQKCVKVIGNEMKFVDAMTYCMGQSPDRYATLVSIHNQYQNSQLAELATDTGISGDIWIGLADNGEYDYEWLDGSNVDFVNWAPGSTPLVGPDATVFMRPQGNGEWFTSFDVNATKCFACQYNSQGGGFSTSRPSPTRTAQRTSTAYVSRPECNECDLITGTHPTQYVRLRSEYTEAGNCSKSQGRLYCECPCGCCTSIVLTVYSYSGKKLSYYSYYGGSSVMVSLTCDGNREWSCDGSEGYVPEISYVDCATYPAGSAARLGWFLTRSRTILGNISENFFAYYLLLSYFYLLFI